MVVYETLSNNIVHAYSDSGHIIHGGFPEGDYNEAYDPVDAHREYVETEEFIPTETTDTVRRFSKYNLETELFKEGLLASVDNFIDSQSITNEHGQSVPLRRFYNVANEFREDNRLFHQYISVIQSTLGISDEKVEKILSASTVNGR